jgi:hypothetical protein
MDKAAVVMSVRHWLETFVVGMNLCPFAKQVLSMNRVRFAVTDAFTEEELRASLHTELLLLDEDSSMETTLLIHPCVLQDFYNYNQFLDSAEALLAEAGLEGVFQIASFHPAYRFAGTDPDANENYTNRSPHPMLHLLRESSLELAIASYSDVEAIPARNIELMKRTGKGRLQALFLACSARGTDAVDG